LAEINNNERKVKSSGIRRPGESRQGQQQRSGSGTARETDSRTKTQAVRRPSGVRKPGMGRQTDGFSREPSMVDVGAINNSAVPQSRVPAEAPVQETQPAAAGQVRTKKQRKKKESVIKERKITKEEYRFHKDMKRRRRKTALVVIVILFLIAVTVFAGYMAYTYMIDNINNPVTEDSIVLDVTTEQKFRVEKRESTKSICERLYEAGLIENKTIYRVLSKFYGYDDTYVAGTYTLSEGLSYEEIMFILSGKPETVKVTFPEGFTTLQMANRLEANNVCTAEEFINAVNTVDISSYEFLNGVDFSGRDYRLDGYLFPDTYEFDVLAKPEDVVYKMLNRFNNIFLPAYYERLEPLGLSLDQVVIMASIVEKEAKLESDRGPIAGVFYNRYKYGTDSLQYFQSNATLRYAYHKVNGEDLINVSTEDTQLDDPYNTYMYPGFTPGPICSPGEASLVAALYFTPHDYYYFLAKSDGSGGHVFSRTYEEHLKAIEEQENYTPPEEEEFWGEE